MILQPKSQSQLSQAEFSQPCCTAVQIALIDLLRSWNINPSAVVGHSSGEIAAAYACGSITANAAILIAYYRGKVGSRLKATHRGGMAAIGLGREKASKYLVPGVAIGCENGPSSITLTGDLDALEAVMAHIKQEEPDILVRMLRVECAYHSSKYFVYPQKVQAEFLGHMQSIAEEYRSLLGNQIQTKDLQVPFYSSVTGNIITSSQDLSASYWIQNLVSPVLFYQAIQTVVKTMHPATIFLEVGPHSALGGPIRQILKSEGKNADYIPTLVRDTDGLEALLTTAGNLWLSNIEVNFSSINPTGNLLTNLPTYPWYYDGEYWVESRLSKEWRFREFDHHELLGTRVTQSTNDDPIWRNMLLVDNVPWLREHEIVGDVLLPGAGYIAMAGEAIRQLTGSDDYSLKHVTLSAALVLRDDVVEIITHLSRAKLTSTLDSPWYNFSISSLSGNTWVKHASGQCRAGSEHELKVPILEPQARKVSAAAWYRLMRRYGFNYGPRFRGLSDISAHVSDKLAVGTITGQDQDMVESSYSLHPASIDCTFHISTASMYNGLERNFSTVSVPTFINDIYIRKPSGPIRVKGNAVEMSRGGSIGDLVGVSESQVVINFKGLVLTPLSDGSEVAGDDPHAGVQMEWNPDIDFIDAATLIRPERDMMDAHRLVDRLGLACMTELRLELQRVPTSQAHFEKFRDWLDSQYLVAMDNRYPNVTECALVANLDSQSRRNLIQELLEASKGTNAEPVAIAIHRIFSSSLEFFAGSLDPLEVLLDDNILTKVYDFSNNSEHSEFLHLLSHQKPNLRILEIGAGTGGTTTTILSALKSTFGERMYSTYTYTDISAGFFVGAKERFKDYQAITYAILDITKDPLQQGFEEEGFDLIVASNVMSSTIRFGLDLQLNRFSMPRQTLIRL
jgi:malonyl CoA-acyl carrier protein transacylase